MNYLVLHPSVFTAKHIASSINGRVKFHFVYIWSFQSPSDFRVASTKFTARLSLKRLASSRFIA